MAGKRRTVGPDQIASSIAEFRSGARDGAVLKVLSRGLAELLAEKAPGGAVEVRIPPYAVVQCVEGTRHTRGTPPAVVETDPVTWIELSLGGLDWASAVDSGRLRASGERSDLSAYLPLTGPLTGPLTQA